MEKMTALQKQGSLKFLETEGESSLSSIKNQFVSEDTGSEIKYSQTFPITLPNLIHKSKKKMK